ncbi:MULTISPECIES: MFS transporter [Streptomyces]|uniref:MFS transporter n=1 Tax=Streptomyces doudnae TaxID=3075536 RepID=A0ABD5EWL5_9ACTN|nr:MULTISPECIES: MFS transporter [unclassified Streptomyces]MDT0439141.1 MFS transporter [Streptomyces sp. DSM 41981]MYQ63750.1 MFS transporter [Streptomyces sp. SID4950]SCD64581.1 drug resistance transporter, EmrB/QacA subfamily [Streptomyces sp. SolWspMP-5a-2]
MTASAPPPGDRGQGAQEDAGYQPDPRRWRALWVTLVAGFMTLLDVTIVAVALPTIQRDLHASPAQVQWVVSGYALTFALALVTAGRLGDALDRRLIFLLALSGFVLFSAACGAAPDITLLVVARLAQGLAAGFMAPQNSALIQQMFRGAERGRAFGFFGSTVGISSAAGPLTGGAILALASGPDGWRWIFYVNVPIGVLAVLLGRRLLPRTPATGRGEVDVPGVLLLGVGVLALMWPLVQADTGGITGLWWLFLAGAAVLGLFVVRQRRLVARGGQPLLDPRLFTTVRGYAVGAGVGTLYFIGFSGVWLVFALFYQHGLGFSPLRSGLAVTPFALGTACAAVVAGRMVERFGRLLTVAGLAGVIAGLGGTALLLLFLPLGTAPWVAAPLLFLGGVGGGFVVSPNITMTLRDVPVRMAGAAGGALQTGQRLGAAVGTAALPGLFYLVLGRGDDYRTAVVTALVAALIGMAASLALAAFDWRRDRRTRPAHRRCPDEVANDPVHSRQT